MGTHVRFMRRLASAVLVVLALAGSASADTFSGIQWLNSALQPTGEVNSGRDIAGPLQTTAESARTLALQGSAGSSAGAMRTYVLTQADLSTEALARKILAAIHSGADASALLIELLAHQDPLTGGFGARRGDQPSIIDTAFAIEALSIAGRSSSPQTAKAIGYLQRLQLADGSWAEGANSPSVYLTALSTAALQLHASTFNLGTSIQNGTRALLAARQSDGLWGEDFLSGISLASLLGSLNDITPVTASVSALRTRQQANGSWQGDAYTTAIVLRALTLAQLRSGGGQVSNGGALSGYVMKAGTDEPIADATVTVTSVSGLSVKTNGSGYFVVSGLPAGTATLVAAKAGYASASAVARVMTGTMAVVNGLVLSPSQDTGTIRLHITDASTGNPLEGVAISLSGAATLSGTTNASGDAEFAGVSTGSYSLALDRSGYRPVTGSFSLSGGSTMALNQPLVSSTSGSSDSTALSGVVVDGTTSAPIAGAVFTLVAGESAVTDSNGRFLISGASGGTYRPTLSATGYQQQEYSIVLPAGVTSHLGTLNLYRSSGTTAPNSVTLMATVLDSVSGKPIAGAQLTVPSQSLSMVADAQGTATLSGIANLKFDLQLGAPGYATQSVTVTVSGFGMVATTFKLAPDVAPANHTVLHGVVVDNASGTPISGAVLQVTGTALKATTDGSGRYQLDNVPGLDFELRATALSYEGQTLGVTLPGKGSYQIDFALDATSTDNTSGFSILTLDALDHGKGSFGTQRFALQVGYDGSDPQEVLLIGNVLNADGNKVATVSAYAEGTQTPQTSFTFVPQETKSLQMDWNPAQLPPGAYSLQVSLARPGTISREVPTGTVMAQRSIYTEVAATHAIAGTLSLNPPVAQAGSSAPARLAALITNAGNVPMVNQTLTMTIKRPSDGAVLYRGQGLVSGLEVGSFTETSFGEWVPSTTGNLSVTVSADSTAVAGTVQGSLYVGDRPQGSFIVTPETVYKGTQKVRARLDVSGVDTRLGASSPLAFAIRQAVDKGGQYVATDVVRWKNSNQCLGCHTVAQASYGLSSLLRRDIAVNAAAAQFASNALMTSQNDDNYPGALFSSHPQYSKTQTVLGTWALTQMPDKLDTFRTQYRAAQFLNSRRTESGNVIYWTGDHDSGWWAGPEAHTMLAVTGIADVLDTASKNDLSSVLDYSLQNGRSITAGSQPRRLKVAADGTLYLQQYSGQIFRVDPTTLTQSLHATVPSGQCRALTPSVNGDLYALCAGNVVRVSSGGGQELIARVGNNIYDIAAGPDGSVYASDPVNNRIFRWTGSGGFEAWLSGGMLNGPTGLDVKPDGTVMVANSRAYNVLAVAVDMTVKVWADGLSFQPLILSPTANGGYHVIHAGVGFAGDGIIEVNAQGRSRRLITLGSSAAIATTDAGTVAANGTNTLYQFAARPIDLSLLPTLRARVEGAARYFLSRNGSNPNNSNTITQAARLLGLFEAGRVITDSTLKAQVEQAQLEIEARLRARQRSDGGWGWYTNYGSDPMVTALVGFALDVRNPPTNDPVVTKAIQYLLKSQNSDKSWGSPNGILSTRQASTSLVMAYLPRALDHLGGLNVDLHLELPSDVRLSQPTVPFSASSSLPSGGQVVTWSLPGVTTQGRAIEFDLTLDSMQPGEKRLAASAAYLLSTNSFNNDQVRVDLPIPSIHATAGLALTSVTTEKSRYVANETAQLEAEVSSVAPVTVAGDVVFSIHATSDQSLVARLPAVPFSNLAPGGRVTVQLPWSVGTTIAGTYTVLAELYDASGHKAEEKSINLAIVSSTDDGGTEATASLRVRTDREAYNTTDLVRIDDLVRNLAVNAQIEDARLKLEVAAPDGGRLSSVTIPLGDLAPGATREAPSTYRLQAAAEGAYQVVGKLLDARGRVLASDSTHFEVVENLAMTLVGSVAVKDSIVYQGDAQTCTDIVTNRGTRAAEQLGLRQGVVDLDRDTSARESRVSADIPPDGGSKRFVRGFTTEQLATGHYACTIEALINGSYKLLASSPFEVKPPPIRIQATLESGTKGRVLVLLDAAPANGSARTEPAPQAQRDFLERLLTREGWSYTIVTDPDAFTWELRSGDYNVYALFAEATKLSEQVQKELREADFRGEGLLEAGAHDQRHQKFDDALGIKPVGKQARVTGIEITASAVLPGGYADLQLGDKALSAQLVQAQPLGRYHGAKSPDLAVATLEYGRGRSLYFGYDLLAEAVLAGDTSFQAELIAQGLSRVQPDYGKRLPGRLVPLQITLQNQGIATPGRLQLVLPQGMAMIDPGAATLQDDYWVWDYSLAVDEEKTFTAWVRLPEVAGRITLTVHVFAGPEDRRVRHTTASLPVDVRAEGGLPEALQLAASSSDYRQVLLWLEKADAALQQGDAESALSHLAKATDELLKLSKQPTPELRLMIDRALLDAGRQLWAP